MIEKELTDINCDPGERHRDESLVVRCGFGEGERGEIESIRILVDFICQGEALFEPRISRRVEPC